MKTLLFLLALVAFTLAQDTLSISDTDIGLQQAATAYLQGDYQTAADSYENLIQQGFHQGDLYFNLGNAYYRMGDLGFALVNYLRAQEEMPRDSALNENLARVRSIRLDIQNDEISVLVSVAALTTETFTVRELSWIVLFLWGGVWMLLLLRMRKSDPSPEKGLGVVTYFLIALVVLLLVLGFLLGGRLISEMLRPAAVVIPQSVSAMSGPGEDYLELFIIHQAAEARIIQTGDQWVWVELPDGRQAWLPARTIQAVNRA